MKILICTFFLIILYSCSHHQFASDALQDQTNPLSAMVAFYRGPLNHLAAVRRGTTVMYPSSSEYALEAMAVHGPVMGWIMTCDRLMRSGRDEVYLAPSVEINGNTYCYDPVAANDFWWAAPSQPSSAQKATGP
jgi:putative component of membrane protein insertase Oxa1/YidC/SpoIIIJ protein YidD